MWQEVQVKNFVEFWDCFEIFSDSNPKKIGFLPPLYDYLNNYQNITRSRSVLLFFYFREYTSLYASDWTTSDIALIDFLTNEHMSELGIPTNQLYQTTTTSSSMDQNITNNCNIDNYFVPLEQLMDSLRSPEDSVVSTYRCDDQNIAPVSND